MLLRYGNVFGSRGSVVPVFLEQMNWGTLSHKDMTRFNITLSQAVDMVCGLFKITLEVKFLYQSSKL